MNVTLKQLRALVAVVRIGSFTHAAEHLSITQPALSGLIKELEQSLGLRLLNRSTRRLELSDVGHELYPLIAKSIQDLDTILSEAQSIKELKKGTVRVAVPQLLACTLLPPAIAAFQKLHPHIRVRLIDTIVENVISRVFSGEVDFGIGPEREPNASIEVHPLFSLPFAVVFKKDHPLASKKTICWSHITAYPSISLRGQFTERLSQELQQAARNIQPHTEVTFMSTALSMTHENLGITVCIPYAESLINQYGLDMRRITDPIVNRDFQVFLRKGHSLSPSADTFRTFLEKHIYQKVEHLKEF